MTMQTSANAGSCCGCSPSDIGNYQAFQYTVIGTEADLSEIVIPLPVARLNTNYEVQVTTATSTNIEGLAIANASRQLAQFTLSLTHAAIAGDIFSFFVINLT